jgi:malate synthase
MKSTEKNAAVVNGPNVERQHEILTPEALKFVAALVRHSRVAYDELLGNREACHQRFAAGELPDFLAETEALRARNWCVAEQPADLLKRTVEITGPVSRKMVINALNSGADCFMADFEDSSAPSWENMISGQVNLYDAVRRTIEFVDQARGKSYKLNESVATLIVRPRGLHLPEAHVEVDGRAIPGSLLDFGLYFFHNAQALIERGSGPYFYLPKLESHLEARWWNDVFVQAQRLVGIPLGAIKATVLIETLPAAFEMDEILHELRDHSSGLNCGRWDYIFSFIKTLRADAAAVLPDRSQVGMTQPFMRAYTQWCVRTCHRRGAHAMGGMAAQIPIKGDADANEAALGQVRTDKLREASDGHDGTWVAHPALVPLAREAFDSAVEGDNQLDRLREDVHVCAADLLEIPSGTRTEAGLRLNVRVGIRYLEAWLRGVGCVPLYHLMEDAATAEISRTQIWQWLRHGAELDDGRSIDPKLVRTTIAEEMSVIADEVGEATFHGGRFDAAAGLFAELCFADELAEFLTLGAYEILITS